MRDGVEDDGHGCLGIGDRELRESLGEAIDKVGVGHGFDVVFRAYARFRFICL